MRGCEACAVGCVPNGVVCLVLVVRGSSFVCFELSECKEWGGCVVSDAHRESGAGVGGSSIFVCGVYLGCACVVWVACVAHVALVLSE